MAQGTPRGNRRRRRVGWDPLATWYDGWVGPEGSEHHRRLALPTVMDLLELGTGESVLDIGAGQGVLAGPVLQAEAGYTGVDLSTRLLTMARRHHPRGRFLSGNAAQLSKVGGLEAASFDAAVFLLSIQDMDPLEAVVSSAAWALRDGGRLVIFMTHPCFRVPRQSGWGWDSSRSLRYRRVDSYLKPLRVPMKAYPGKGGGTTISFHRPLHSYVSVLAANGLFIDRFEELPGLPTADEPANPQIPLFLALRARRIRPGTVQP